MIENTNGKESLALNDTPEFLTDTAGEGILNENEHIQDELMGLRGEVSKESKERTLVSPITAEDIELLTKRST